MLESKNKVYQKVLKAGGKFTDTSAIEQTMSELNKRFQV